MPQLRVKQERSARRCEICHQSDCFDAENNHCQRCSDISPTYYRVTFPSPKLSTPARVFAWQQRLLDDIREQSLSATFCISFFAVIAILYLYVLAPSSPTCISGTDWSVQGGGEDFTIWGCGGYPYSFANNIDDLVFVYFTILLTLGALVMLYGWLRSGYYSIIFNNR